MGQSRGIFPIAQKVKAQVAGSWKLEPSGGSVGTQQMCCALVRACSESRPKVQQPWVCPGFFYLIFSIITVLRIFFLS